MARLDAEEQAEAEAAEEAKIKQQEQDHIWALVGAGQLSPPSLTLAEVHV